MVVFHWNDKLKTGLKQVDEQHHKLVDLTNKLGDLLAEDNIQDSDIKNMLKELSSYVYYHFLEEETEMLKYGVDIRHVQHHKFVHASFIHDIKEAETNLNRGKVKVSEELFDFLMNWLVYHILGSDMSMARQIKSIKDGVSPKDAYEKIEAFYNYEKEKKLDQATSMLLQSMNNLFEQVAHKNRDLKEVNNDLEEIVKNRTLELNEANKRLHKLTTTDVLTGLANRKKAITNLLRLWEESDKNSFELSCIRINIDDFKELNDDYGYEAGDSLIKEIAKELKNFARINDIVCRMGGDEFLIICSRTDSKSAINLADIIHKRIIALNVKIGEDFWNGSISVGVATKIENMKNLDELIKETGKIKV